MPSSPVRPVEMIYLGGDVVTPGAASVQVVTMPGDCTIIELRPNGDDLYFLLNGGGVAAGANSPGFVADGGGEVVGPIAGLQRLDVYMASGTVHLMFFKLKGSMG